MYLVARKHQIKRAYPPARAVEAPVTAWKRADIVLIGGKPTLQGLGHLVPYKIDDVAHCETLQCLEAPQPYCRCGFYAYKDRKDAESHQCSPLAAVLEVELFGKVIVHKLGYRAEKQRVLSITLWSECSGSLCPEKAAYLRCADSGLWPICEFHRRDLDWQLPDLPIRISDLASALGTEVRWAS